MSFSIARVLNDMPSITAFVRDLAVSVMPEKVKDIFGLASVEIEKLGCSHSLDLYGLVLKCSSKTKESERIYFNVGIKGKNSGTRNRLFQANRYVLLSFGVENPRKNGL